MIIELNNNDERERLITKINENFKFALNLIKHAGSFSIGDVMDKAYPVGSVIQTTRQDDPRLNSGTWTILNESSSYFVYERKG